jgi:ankyrin repeat protein
MTALHWTAREGHTYLTKVLLQKFRSNAGAKDIYGRTALHLAVAKRQIPCIIRIFVEGGQLNSLDNEKRNVRSIAPDAYTKYLLEKLEEVKFIIRAKGLRDVNLYRQELEKHVKYILDESSLYF